MLLLAVATRVWLLWVTRNQPVWWDEAEYLLKARSIAQGTPDTGYFSGHPIVMSLWLSGFFALGWGETAMRVALSLASIATIAVTHDVGRRLFGVREATVAALLMTMFYVPAFYAARLMTEIPHLLFCLLGVDLYLANTRRSVWLVGPVLAVAALLRFPAALMFLAVGIHAVFARRHEQKVLWLSGVLAVVVVAPYLLWSAHRYGDALHAWRSSAFIMPRLAFGARLGGLGQYLSWMGASLGIPLTVALVLGVLRPLAAFVGPSTSVGRANSMSTAAILAAAWLAVPLLYFGLSVRPILDRYVILVLPPVFLLIARGLTWAFALAPQRWGRGTEFAALALVLAAALALARDAERAVRDKLTSFAELRDAGNWVKQHAIADAVLVTTSPPQLTYYAERATYAVPDDATAFARLRAEHQPRYLIVSRYQETPAWLGAADLNALGARVVATFPDTRPYATVLELALRP